MPVIPVLRVRYLSAFARLLAEQGYDSDKYLSAIGLESEVQGQPEAWMPVSQLVKFIEIAVSDTGYVTLGLDADSRTPLHIELAVIWNARA